MLRHSRYRQRRLQPTTIPRYHQALHHQHLLRQLSRPRTPLLILHHHLRCPTKQAKAPSLHLRYLQSPTAQHHLPSRTSHRINPINFNPPPIPKTAPPSAPSFSLQPFAPPSSLSRSQTPRQISKPAASSAALSSRMRFSYLISSSRTRPQRVTRARRPT